MDHDRQVLRNRVQEFPPLPAETSRVCRNDVFIAIGLATVALILNYFFWVRGHFGGFSKLVLHSPDQMSYASLARNLVRGQGFIDQAIYPASLKSLARIPQPWLDGSLFPLLLVPFFVLGSVADVWAVVPVWLLYGCLVGMSYLFFRSILSEKWGGLAALLVAIDPTAVRLSVGALPELPVAVSLVAVFVLIAKKVHPLWIGMAWGVVFGLRPAWVIVLPSVLYACPAGKGETQARLRAWAMLLGGWFLVAWPWMLRNILLSGNPFYSYLTVNIFTQLPSFEGINPKYLYEYPSPMLFVLSHPLELMAKFKTVFVWLLGITRPPALWVLFLALPFSVVFIRRHTLRNACLLTVLLGLLPLFFGCVQPRFFTPLMPFLVLISVHLTYYGVSSSENKRVVPMVSGLAILLLYLALGIWSFPPVKGHYYGQGWVVAEEVQALQELIAPEQTVASDVAFAVAWQCDRTCVFLPETERGFRSLNDRIPVDFVFFNEGANSRFLLDYRQGGWFEHRFAEEEQFQAQGEGVLYRRRGIAPKHSLGNRHLFHLGNVLYLYDSGEIIHLFGNESGDTSPVFAPPDTIRSKGNKNTKAIYLLTRSGVIWTMGASSGFPMVSQPTVPVDFSINAQGEGCYFLFDNGSVSALGNVPLLPPTQTLAEPHRIEVTDDGLGYYVLSRFGPVTAVGSARAGYSPYFFPDELAADLALDPQGRGYYVLDVYGGIHVSGSDLPIIVTRYDDHRKWAVDLEVLEDGSAYVLSEDGMIFHCNVREMETAP